MIWSGEAMIQSCDWFIKIVDGGETIHDGSGSVDSLSTIRDDDVL